VDGKVKTKSNKKPLSRDRGKGKTHLEGFDAFPPPFREAVVNSTRVGDLACVWANRSTHLQLRDSAGLCTKQHRLRL